MRRREFLQALAAASVAGLPLDAARAADDADGERVLRPLRAVRQRRAAALHRLPRAAACRCYFREPSVNLGVGRRARQAAAPRRRGAAAAASASRPARATRTRSPTSTSSAPRARYGKMGGFAHLATLVKRLRGERPGALLLDGGDTWQGSATSLWTRGQDMVDAAKLLGVDVMTGHWEFTLRRGAREGSRRQATSRARIDFLAQNVKHRRLRRPGVQAVRDARDQRRAGRRSSARRFRTRRSPIRATSCPTGRSASRKRSCRRCVDEARAKGAQVVVLLSHNGMDVDLKLASRVHRHRRDPRRPHARRRAAADARRERAAARRSSPTPAATASSSACSISTCKRRQGRRLPLPAAAGVREPAARRPRDGRADRAACARRIEAKLGEKLAVTEGAAVPPRQLQRHVRPADPRRADGGEGRRDRVLARLPLGHDAAAGRGDHASSD